MFGQHLQAFRNGFIHAKSIPLIQNLLEFFLVFGLEELDYVPHKRPRPRQFGQKVAPHGDMVFGILDFAALKVLFHSRNFEVALLHRVQTDIPGPSQRSKCVCLRSKGHGKKIEIKLQRIVNKTSVGEVIRKYLGGRIHDGFVERHHGLVQESFDAKTE